MNLETYLSKPRSNKEVKAAFEKSSYEETEQLVKSIVHPWNHTLIKAYLLNNYGSWLWSMYQMFVDNETEYIGEYVKEVDNISSYTYSQILSWQHHFEIDISNWKKNNSELTELGFETKVYTSTKFMWMSIQKLEVETRVTIYQAAAVENKIRIPKDIKKVNTVFLKPKQFDKFKKCFK